MQRKNALCLAAAGVGAGLVARGIWRQYHEIPLFGKVVLITGGAGELGLALARAFGAEGCRIAICAKDPTELELARKDLQGRGVRVFAMRCDVTDRAQVDGMIGAAVDHCGAIDILINHARQFQAGTGESVRLEEFDQTMEEMFWGIVYPTVAVLPEMLERRSGCLVNIISGGGKIAGPHLVPYESAQFAAVGFSESLRAELATDGITVITLEPSSRVSADRAARQIVSATRGGDAERILTSTVKLLDRVNRLLPPNGNQGRNGKRRAPWISALAALGRMAAHRYLQL